ncbi:hypothetical protein KCU83_g4686, partial [Aureobasidium melanogenum]
MAPPSDRTLRPTAEDADDDVSLESEDSPPHKKPRHSKKQVVILDDDTSPASDSDAASPLEDDPASAIEDDLTRLWHTNLEKLHHCTMSNKYAAAMSTQNGDWDFDRDVAFAMDSLLPWTKELLASGSRPSESSFKDFRWIDTKAPGVYACLAVKKDLSGNIISRILKVGCAWSVDGGLKSRKWEHLNDKLSKEYADTGSPFHQYIQSTSSSEILELNWYTLAMGEPFVRKTQEDEYLAARYYQIEAMLASALGALHPDSSDYKFRGMQWWAFDDEDTQEPWIGGDSHNAIRDGWSNRPAMRSEDEIAERKAAETARETARQRRQQTACVEGDIYLCTIDGCPRGVKNQGQGFGCPQALDSHLEWHDSDKNIRDDLYLCTVQGCPRAETGHRMPTRTALQAHINLHNNQSSDAHLCTHQDCGRSEPGKGFKSSTSLARHLDSHERGVAVTEPLKKHSRTKCIDPRCGYKQHAIFLVEHEKQHKTGRFACGACGLKYAHAVYANNHALTECKIENAAQIHVPPTLKIFCPEERCRQWRENTELGQANLDKHIKAQHENGRGNCGICGMQWRGIYAHRGFEEDDELCAGSTRKPKETKKKKDE